MLLHNTPTCLKPTNNLQYLPSSYLVCLLLSPLYFLMNLALFSHSLPLLPMNSCSPVTSTSMLTIPPTLLHPTFCTSSHQPISFNMSTSQPTSRTTRSTL